VPQGEVKKKGTIKGLNLWVREREEKGAKRQVREREKVVRKITRKSIKYKSRGGIFIKGLGGTKPG